MTTRRGFLSLLCAAPFVAPVVAKAAVAERFASGGYVRGISGVKFVGEMTTESMITPKQLQTLNLTVDTLQLRSEVNEMVRLARTVVQCSPADDPHDPVPDYFC